MPFVGVIFFPTVHFIPSIEETEIRRFKVLIAERTLAKMLVLEEVKNTTITIAPTKNNSTFIVGLARRV